MLPETDEFDFYRRGEKQRLLSILMDNRNMAALGASQKKCASISLLCRRAHLEGAGR